VDGTGAALRDWRVCEVRGPGQLGERRRRHTTAPELTIRSEEPAEIDEIRALNVAAFGQPREARLVDDLRASDAFIPELSLVAVWPNKRIVGHLLISWVDLVNDAAGTSRRVLSIAPLAVLPEHQKQGIGGALMNAGIAAADARSEPIIVLLGHPSYYPRFGFEPARQFGIEPPEPVRDEVWMVLRLAGWDPSIRGRVVYPPAFEGV
jgi:putative acetyltransferase